MTKITAAIIFGLAGLVIGAMGTTYAWLNFVETGDRNRALTSARLQLQTLDNLRDRDVQTAIRIQEKMLDASAYALDGLTQEDADDKEANVLLERIRKYREEHPGTGGR
jgi:hypothetical protein